MSTDVRVKAAPAETERQNGSQMSPKQQQEVAGHEKKNSLKTQKVRVTHIRDGDGVKEMGAGGRSKMRQK